MGGMVGAWQCAWCMVHGAWCMVHGAWCMVHGAWCMVHGAHHLVPTCVVIWRETGGQAGSDEEET